jgi:DNA polymerase III epsilon subunit-like protein
MYAFIDTETSGLDESVNAVLQVALVATDCQLNKLFSYMSYVKPREGAIIEPKAIAINKINLALLGNAPDEFEVTQTIGHLLFGRTPWTFAGYNTPFDRKFIKAMFQRNKRDMDYFEPAADDKDVMLEFKRLNTPFWKLMDAMAYFDISPPEGALHDALVDINGTIEVAKKLCSV